MMTSHEFEILLERYLQHQCSSEEEKLVEEWFEKLGNNKSVAILDQRKKLVKDRMRRQLQANIKDTAHKSARTRQYVLPQYYLKIAAGLLLLVLTIYFLPFDFSGIKEQISFEEKGTATELEVTNPERFSRIIDLSDGSRVTLQPGSELRILKPFGATREVHLLGEGFFEIKRDVHKPFLVYSKEIVTTVLGTSFRVKAYEADKQITVTVKTGSVSVSNQSADNKSQLPKEVILKRNQKAVYDRKENSIVTTLADNPEAVQPLITLNMQYKKEQVNNIFRDLEEGYGIDIAFDEKMLENCLLTTTLINENFYERIEIICKAIGAQYEVTDSGVIVKKNEPCTNSITLN